MKSNTKILTTALLLTSAIALAGCSSSSDSTPPPSPPIGDINGTWNITEVLTSQAAGCSGVDTYGLNVVQNGNTATLTDSNGNVFKNAVLSGNKLTWSGSYPEAPGTTTSNATATIGANCSSLTATATWSYTETGFACSGTSAITGTRISGGNSC